MVVLYNILPFVIVLVGALAAYMAYRKFGVKGAVISAALVLLALMLYSTVQPSYLPKGTVPTLSPVPIAPPSTSEIENRLKEPMSEAQRQQRVEEIITVRDEIKQILTDDTKAQHSEH